MAKKDIYVGGPKHLTAPPGIDLRALSRILWRRRHLIGAVAAVTTLMAAVLAFLRPLQYTAQSLVVIDARQEHVVDLKAVLTGITPNEETIQSEIELIQSPTPALEVINQLRLEQNPEFNIALQDNWWSNVLAHLDIFAAQADAIQETEAIYNVVRSFRRHLSVLQLRQSGVIAINFTSESPVIAVRAANALADAYLKNQVEAKLDAARRAALWLGDRITGFQNQVERSEQAAEKFRIEAGLTQGRNVLLIEQEISDISTQLTLAAASRAETEARLQQVRGLVRAGGVDSAAKVLQSDLITRLRAQEADLIREAGEHSMEYGQRHPRMVNIQAQLHELQIKISAEIEKLIQGYQNDVEVAKARQKALEQQLEQQKMRLAEAKQAAVKLASLTREADANRGLLETFLSRWGETKAQTGVDAQSPDARVLARASLPLDPSNPPALVILVGAVAGSLVGLLAALVREHFDRAVRTTRDVEQAAGVPVLSYLPVVETKSSLGKAVKLKASDWLSFRFVEAVRSLHVSLLLASPDGRPPNVVLVTSSHPAEGKTTVTMCLARVWALAGYRCVWVEGDLRKPSAHTLLQRPLEDGIDALLEDKTDLAHVLYQDHGTGAFFLPAGRKREDSLQVVSSVKFKAIIDELASRFDCVVIDSPPVMAVADARMLSTMADVILYVVRWGRTSPDVLRAGINQLAGSGSRLAGVVISMVDGKEYGSFDETGGAYYSGSIKGYYAK